MELDIKLEKRVGGHFYLRGNDAVTVDDIGSKTDHMARLGPLRAPECKECIEED